MPFDRFGEWKPSGYDRSVSFYLLWGKKMKWRLRCLQRQIKVSRNRLQRLHLLWCIQRLFVFPDYSTSFIYSYVCSSWRGATAHDGCLLMRSINNKELRACWAVTGEGGETTGQRSAFETGGVTFNAVRWRWPQWGRPSLRGRSPLRTLSARSGGCLLFVSNRSWLLCTSGWSFTDTPTEDSDYHSCDTVCCCWLIGGTTPPWWTQWGFRTSQVSLEHRMIENQRMATFQVHLILKKEKKKKKQSPKSKSAEVECRANWYVLLPQRTRW